MSVPGQLAIDPFHVAVEKGYYAHEGLEVELIQMRDTVANQALIGGNVEFATPGGASLTAIIAGLPARIVFTGFQRPFWHLYVRAEIREIAALKGKRIGIPGGIGGAPDQYLREVLRRFGLDGAMRTIQTNGRTPPSISEPLASDFEHSAAAIGPCISFAAKNLFHSVDLSSLRS